MSVYVEYIEDSDGSLVDVYYYCSAVCASDGAGRIPVIEESDTCTYCQNCKDLMAHGLQCPAWQNGEGVDSVNVKCNGGVG